MSSSKREGDLARLRALVLRLTNRRVYCVQEVKDLLRKQGLPEDSIQKIVSDCQRQGLLDDGVCARLWADHWAGRGYSWVAIHSKLRAKGLDEADIQQAASILARPSEEHKRARAVLTKHLVQPPTLHDKRQRTRLARTLAVRGFDPDSIERVLNESLGIIPDDE